MDLTATLLCTVKGTVTEGDAPAAGLTVTLTDASGAAQTAQTDANGEYAFTALAAGVYQFNLQLPENKAIVSANGQAAQSVGAYNESMTLNPGDARADQWTMEATASITGAIKSLGAGQSIAARFGQRAAFDPNGGGWRALLSRVSSAATTRFTRPLTAGQTLLDNSQWKVTEQGNMIWITVSVTAGNVYTLPAVEYVAMTSIEGVAYMDADGDAQYAQGEQLMSGVMVALQRKDGDAWTDVANLTTDAYGRYVFQNLTAGLYRVVSQAADGVNVASVGPNANAVGEAALGDQGQRGNRPEQR